MSELLIEEPGQRPERPGLIRLGSEAFRVLTPPAVRLSGAGVQFLSTVMIARQLGDEKSALFFFWSAILTSFAPVATYGLEQIALRATPRMDDPSQLKIYLGRLRFLSTTLALIIGIALMLYAMLRSGSPSFEPWHLLLPFALAAMSLAIINGEALKGLSRPVAGIAFGHFVPVSLFCLLIVLNLNHLSSPFLICIYTAAWVTAQVLLRFGPIPSFRARLFSIPRRQTRSTILAEGFPVFCTNSLGALSYVVPLVLLDFLRPAEEVAYVTTSFRISILFAILATAIHGVFAPQLSKATAIPGNGREVGKVYLKITGITLLTLLVPYTIGIAFPDWVMSIFGKNFRAGADTLRLLLATGLFAIALGPILQLLLMIGKTRWMARLGILKLSLVTILSALLIPRYGGIGMVIAMATAFAIEEITGIILAYRHLRNTDREHAS